MIRRALLLSLIWLAAYPLVMQTIPWLEWTRPRGGILGLSLYLLFANCLLVFGAKSGRAPAARIQGILGGWLLLAMPPLWYLITLALLR